MPYNTEIAHLDDPWVDSIDGYCQSADDSFRAQRTFRDQLLDRADPFGAASVYAETVPKILFFAEAATELKGVLDLNKARDAAIEQQERWGLVQAIIDARIVTDRNAYRALFDMVRFTEAGLRSVYASIEREEPQRAVFNPGGLTLPGAFKTLFIDAGIPYGSTYALNNLGDVRYVRPDQFEGLEKLHTLSREAQLAAFAAAYQKASALSVGQPTVLFTPDQREVTATGEFATNHMQFGMQAIDPFSDFIRWRAQVDTALNENSELYTNTLQQAFAKYTIGNQLPDQTNITQYPSFVLPNGSVLAFLWNPNTRRVYLEDYSPDFTSKYLGPRLALA